METKNEVIPVSEEAPVSAEKSATRGKAKAAAADKPHSEKKATTKKPARKTVKKASVESTEEEKKETKKTSENESEATPNAETTAPSVPTEALSDASQKEASLKETPKKKPAARRKTTTVKAEEKKAEALAEAKAEAPAKAEEEKAEPKKKTASDASKTKRKTAEKKPAAKKAPAKKIEKSAEKKEKIEEVPAAEAPKDETIEKIDPIAELKAVMLEQKAEAPEAAAPITEEDLPAITPTIAEPPAEEKKEEPTVDVSGTPAETFFFMSPAQISAMEKEKVRLENEARAEAEAEPEMTPEATIETVEAVPVVTEEDKEAAAEEPSAELPAPEEAPAESAPTSGEETATPEEVPEMSVATAEETITEAPEEAPAAAETVEPQTAEEQAPRRRNDPHQKDVMDKDRIRKALVAFLEEADEIDRRVLIESTMKQIPLTDEEREDNRPVSLSNRVRSVIGSVLSEMGAAGKIRAVNGGRKLTMRPLTPAPEKEQAEPAPAVKEAKEAKSEKAEKTEKAEKLEKAEKAEKLQKEEAPVTASIDGGTPAIIDFGFTPVVVAEEKPAKVSPPVKEEKAEKAAAPAPSAPAKQSIRGPKEDEDERGSEETPIEAESADQEIAEMHEPATAEPTVHPTVRRVRASSRSDRQQKPTASVSAVLITEEEIERVILNAVRRNSATKNDILAALKRVYVDPYRLGKDEENRIYVIAGNVLQKLLARNAIQTVDGRYMNKPSHRVLNPGVAQSAYSTGNVETRFINELNRQSGDFFEQFAAKLLEKYFEMSNIKVDASYVVGGSDDNGIDIMIETTDFLGYRESVLVQAKKRATQPVTLKEVREFYGALCAEEGTRGVFITTSSFCMEASKMIGKVRNLIAIDKRKLFALAEHCEVGLYRDEEGRLLLDENLFLEYDV